MLPFSELGMPHCSGYPAGLYEMLESAVVIDTRSREL